MWIILYCRGMGTRGHTQHTHAATRKKHMYLLTYDRQGKTIVDILPAVAAVDVVICAVLLFAYQASDSDAFSGHRLTTPNMAGEKNKILSVIHLEKTRYSNRD